MQEELVAVLKANHLSTGKAVAKKAQTIMRQADADESGTLTLDEFLVVAKKFPNLVSHPFVLLHRYEITFSLFSQTNVAQGAYRTMRNSMQSIFARWRI